MARQLIADEHSERQGQTRYPHHQGHRSLAGLVDLLEGRLAGVLTGEFAIFGAFVQLFGNVLIRRARFLCFRTIGTVFARFDRLV